ncbi:sigma-70 family RNA polymerase sigma factor [Streptosporangium sp. NPDC049248]|uniref:RNA polymerase sigma factor n=1 Tax=Streptosporangium sp. NPDC049248 TaxID=3155651 RepID=UPI0034403143
MTDPIIYVSFRRSEKAMNTGSYTAMTRLREHMTDADEDLVGQIAVKAYQDYDLSCKMASMPEFAAFYEREAKALLGFVMKAGADGELAADIVQASFLDALPKWETIREPRAWLRKVAIRKLWRVKDPDRSREDSVEELPDGERLLPSGHRAELLHPDAVLELSEEAQRVVRLIAALSPSQRLVMAWHMDGYSTEEMSTHLQMSKDAVRQNLTRARSALKQMLNGGDGA